MSHPITIQARLSLMVHPFLRQPAASPFDHAKGAGVCGRFSTVRRDIASEIELSPARARRAGDVKDASLRRPDSVASMPTAPIGRQNDGDHLSEVECEVAIDRMAGRAPF